ncbi:AAA family ATPase [Nonomuraea wenchangensis]|uniref:AAA family ATPase n=1 Tax=Nonomuraea wenchangensis TaxID=568860 RepID=UPI00384CACCA
MLCGRQAEIHRIDTVLQDARQGRSGVLVLRGEAGIGKTTMLEHARAAATGMRVLSVRGSEPERNLTFAGLAQLVTPARNLLHELPPAQARALRGAVALGPPEQADRFTVYAATFSLLAQLAEDLPLLLTVDDAHVLDIPSVEAIAFAARRLAAEGIALLVASRSQEPAQDAVGHLPSIVLTGLNEAAAGELIVSHSGVQPHRNVVRRLVAGTGGNPMALRETLDHLTPGQLRGQRPVPDFVPAEATAGSLFARRVEALGPAAQTALLLLAASFSPRLGSVMQAAEIMQITESAFDELESSGLVELAPGTFRFTHPLVATAALANARPAQCRAAHRVLAAVLIDPGRADERALHLAEATLGTDERVAAALEAMATAARARSGYAAAVMALERAAALSEDDAARARRLYAAAADAQLAGQNARARQMLIAADGLAMDKELRIKVATGRSRVEAFTGHPRLAHRILQEAAEFVADGDPSRRAELLTDSAMAALLAGDAIAAVGEAAEAARLAPDPSGTVALVIKLVQGITLMHLGRHREGALQLAGCTRLAEPGGPADEYVILGCAAMTWIGQHETGGKMVRPILSRLRADGALGLLPFALYALGLAEARSGHMAAARATASEGLELAELTGDEMWRYLCLAALAYIEAIRGDDERCREHARMALELQGPDTDYPRDPTEALALLEMSRGRYREAIAWYDFGARTTQTTEPPTSLVEGNRDRMEAHIRSGLALTGTMSAMIDELAGDSGFSLDAAVAWRLKGLVAAEPDVTTCFDTALKLHAEVLCPFETARTRLAYGERLRRMGRRVAAREQLRPALHLFDQIEARVWSGRARKELAATGETLHPPIARSPLETLTPQEYQVAHAVVRGATNREAASALFLSAKTIEYHLGNVYRKLSVHTRTELAFRFPQLAAE